MRVISLRGRYAWIVYEGSYIRGMRFQGLVRRMYLELASLVQLPRAGAPSSKSSS